MSLPLLPLLAQAAATPAAAHADDSTFQTILNEVSTRGLDIGIKVLGAIAAWVIGAWVIRMLGRIFGRALSSRRIDSTLAS